MIQTNPPEKVAMKFFLIEFETLAINMLKNPNMTHSSSKLTRRFKDIEPGFTYGLFRGYRYNFYAISKVYS